jgi:hypothetical protein
MIKTGERVRVRVDGDNAAIFTLKKSRPPGPERFIYAFGRTLQLKEAQRLS